MILVDTSLLSYLPIDRRQALVRDIALPDRATGAALFADISGFTLSPRRWPWHSDPSGARKNSPFISTMFLAH